MVDMPEPSRIEAIDRAVRLIVALADAGPDGAPLAELAATTGVNKSTAYRALATLRGHLFATQSSTSGNYRLGPAAMTLGDRVWTPQHLAESVHPALLALSREVGELVHLGVWADDQVLYIDKVEPERPIRVWSAVGQRVPLATSALGRALLAARNVADEQLPVYLASAPADRGVTLGRLRDAVHATRRRGYSTEIEENEPGVACLGMAILRDERPVAAVSITSLAGRMGPDTIANLAAAMRRTVGGLLPEGLVLMRPEAEPVSPDTESPRGLDRQGHPITRIPVL